MNFVLRHPPSWTSPPLGAPTAVSKDHRAEAAVGVQALRRRQLWADRPVGDVKYHDGDLNNLISAYDHHQALIYIPHQFLPKILEEILSYLFFWVNSFLPINWSVQGYSSKHIHPIQWHLTFIQYRSIYIQYQHLSWTAFSFQSLYKMLEGMGQRPSGDPKARARFVKIIKFGLGLVGWIC